LKATWHILEIKRVIALR